MTTTTARIPLTAVPYIGAVGQQYTVGDRQFTCHSVEGRDWYAFAEKDGLVTVDVYTTSVDIEPKITLIPNGHKIGEGFAEEFAYANPRVKRGVCLAKSWV